MCAPVLREISAPGGRGYGAFIQPQRMGSKACTIAAAWKPGDRDEVTVEHSLAVVAALPDARLAVLPGTHTLPVDHPELVNPLIQSFLQNIAPAPDWNAFIGG